MSTKSVFHIAIVMVVLGVALPALAYSSYPMRDARVTIAGYRFGMVDMAPGSREPPELQHPFTLLDAGPLGMFNLPFDIPTATYAVRHAAPTLLRP